LASAAKEVDEVFAGAQRKTFGLEPKRIGKKDSCVVMVFKRKLARFGVQEKQEAHKRHKAMRIGVSEHKRLHWRQRTPCFSFSVVTCPEFFLKSEHATWFDLIPNST